MWITDLRKFIWKYPFTKRFRPYSAGVEGWAGTHEYFGQLICFEATGGELVFEW